MMLSKIFNALLILLFIWAGSIQANEPFATRLTPRIIIANEFNELLIRDVEGKLINRIAINTLGNDINNIAAGDFDGGSDDIVVHVNDQVNDQVLFYQLNGTAGALYSVEPASDIAVGNIDSDDLTEFFITDAMSHRVFVYDHDAKPITNFNINGLDDNTSLSIATADINNDGVVEIIVGDLLTEDKVAIYDLNGTEITTFSVFESSNTRSRRAIRKPGDQGKACEKGNASFCDESTPSTPPPSDDTDSSAPPPSNDTGSSAPSSSDDTDSSAPPPSNDTGSSAPSSSDNSGSSSPPPSDDTADTGSSTPPPSDDTDSSTPPSSDKSGSSTSDSSDNTDTSTSDSSDNTDTSTSDSSDNTDTSTSDFSDNTDTSTSETGSSVSSSDETPTTSPTQPVTQPTLPTQPATPPIQPTQPTQPVTPEPIPEAPPIPHFGVKVAAGDVNGDGIPEIIVGMASNGGMVEIYTDQGEKISQFDTAFEKGVEITAGDVNQDGIDEIIVGDANGMTIQILDLNGELINDFQGSDNGNIASLAFGKEALEETVPLESPTTNTESSATIPTDPSSATTPNEQSSETTANDPSSETTPNEHSSETTPNEQSSETTSNEQSSETTSNEQSSETTADSSTADSSESTTVVSLPIVSLPPTTGSINQTGNYNGQTVTDAVIESDTSIANVKLAGEITNQGLLSNATILPGATLTGGTLTGYVDNQGTIADTQFVGATLSGGDLDGEITITSDPDKGLGILKAVTILPNAIVTGGALSGEILNHGTLSDITVNSDAIVTGGTVQGPIDNAGSLQNIILGEDTYINGGDLSGTVAGNSNDIALIENATIHDADLSYVQISEGTQLGPNVVIGTGVIFDNNALIPSGSDLSLVLVSEFDEAGSLAINLDADVLAETKVYQETDNPTLLKQINSLPKIKDNDWQLVQNPENGQIELTIEGVHFVLIPVQVTQVSASQPAGFTVYDDNSVSFVTGYGREIFAQPVIQNKKALLEALAEISEEIIVQDDGTFKVKINDEWKTYRVSLSSEPVNSDDALGLFENADGSIRLVFEDNSGQKRQQQIYPLQEAGTEAEAQENFSGCEIDNYAQNTSTFAPRMKSGRVAPGQAKKIAHDEAELDVGANAVDGPTRLCIKSLYSLEIQELDPGMTNVTKGPRKGYRFFPKGMKFKNKVKVTVPYSKSLIPTGHTEDDIKTFYFDRELGKWQELERVELDSKANNVISYTDHFTDMINSVVTVPESPQSVSFNPTQIKDIKAADPGAGINLIEVPQANNMGDMRLSYPLEIPPGRVGMQPQLGVSYSSAGGNGWMGLNWSLSIPSVDIHTGWGVPRYSASQETETYTLGGGMLTPVAHRDELQPRSPEKIFHSRVEGAFQKIIRHGTHPSNYWWEVIDKNGSKSFYGGDPASGLVVDAVLTDYNGNIFKWALRETRDTNGNNVQYRYVRVNDVGLAQGSVQGYELYIKTIHYTGYENQAGRYKVTFIRDRELGESRRPDVTISNRGAFKQVTADLLRQVEIRFDDQLVRSYVFNYQQGAFYKTLLESITQLGEDGSAFNTHTFNYYDDIRHATGDYKDGFGGTEGWNTQSDNLSANLLAKGKASALGGNVSEGVGGHIFIGINIGGDIKKDRCVGAKVGYNKSKSKGMVAFLDINGDGLPDKVYKEGGIRYRPNKSGPYGGTVFGEERPVHGLSDISKDETRLISVGAEIYFVGFVGFNKNNTRTKQTIYFSDVNGDGLVDLVNNGSVRFNHLNSAGDPTFTANSADTPAPVGQGVVDTTDLLENSEQEYQQQIDTFPLLDILRRWTAPFSGQIAITGNVALIEDTSAERQIYNSADGVRVAIQHNDGELWGEQIAATDYAEKIPTSVDAVTVKKGDVIYFRVQSVFDGAYDQVSWTPEIQYLNVWISPEIEEGIEPPVEPTANADNEVEPTLDINNLDVYQYKAATDFVLSGAQGSYVNIPIKGTVRAVGELQKVGTTTDDVTLVLLKNDEPVFEQTLTWDEIGLITLEQDVEVNRQDKLELQIHTDSPIDLAQLVWNLDNPLRLFYVESPDVETLTDEQGNPVIKVEMFANYTIYSASNLDLPLEAFVAPETGEYSVESSLALSPEVLLLPEEELAKLNDVEIVITLKRRVAEATEGDTEESDAEDATEGDTEESDAEDATGSDTEESNAEDATESDTEESDGEDATESNAEESNEGDEAERQIELLGKHVITILDGMVLNGSFTFEANKGDELFVEFSTTAYELLATLSQIDAGIKRPSGATLSVPTEFHSVSQPQMIATPYRGWSVFGYNGNRERADQPILITKDDLSGKALQDAAENLEDQEDDLRAKIDNGELDENFDPGIPDLVVIPFYPQLAQQRWKSTDENAWVQAAIMSSSRNGLDQIEVLSSSSFAGASAVAKLSKSKQKGVAAGIGAGGINASAGFTKATSRGLLDFMDMNGDRCPDIVSQGRVQFTNLLCALEGSSRSILSDAVRSTKSESMNLGIGGTFPMSKFTGSGNDAGSVLQMVSLGVSGGVSQSESDTQYDLMDINGDGLPDRVSFSGGTLRVAFNLGYRFAGMETWGGGDINHRNSKGGSLGGSLGFNTDFYGFGGGISLTQSKNGDKAKSLMDINGDGLLDLVERGNGIRVRLNTGNGFSGPMINWSSGGKTSSTSTSLGGGAYFTFGFSFLPLLPIAIIINPGADYSKSMNRPEDSIADIDGDGFSDYLESKKDSHINVRRSQIKRTNLLKSVQRPLGASFEVEYERSGNTYKQPHSKWVMSRVAVHDGHEGDGVDVQVKTYRYEEGFYNRQERDFYGYRVLVEEHRDASKGDKLYRSITREFHNDSYYTKGLLVKETTTDADGKKYLETENTYLLRNVDTGGELVNPNHLTATVFPELRRVDKRFYEGQPQAGKTTYTENHYDVLGNIIHFVDGADVGTQDDVIAEIGYFQDEANYIVGKANKIVVTDNDGTVLRRREAVFESGTGNLKQVSIYLANGSAATSNIDYDQYGNIERLTGPSNYKGQRYSLTYTYDDAVFTHNTSVTDSFGYVSRGDYNLKYGKVVKTTDINNNPLDYTYDQFGRVKTIVGPYQTGTGLDTILFEYHPEAKIPWALTQHIDVYRNVNDPIETVLFTDGLKRVLQTKKDATIHTSIDTEPQDVMTVSGHVTFDFLGRGIEQFYPITEALGKAGVFNTSVDKVQPTVTVYDVMDRTVSTTIPDATSTLTAYGFGSDRNEQTQFKTKVTDANGIFKETFKDVRGVITAVKEFNEGATLWTSYEYDPLKQIVTVIDDQNNATTVSYDNLGRRTQIDSPDMGLTETVYDLASNVRQKITANLRLAGQAIVYAYDYNRLSSITYPPQFDDKGKELFPAIDVAYTYGAPGAAYNRANRIITVTDQSGMEERFYGHLGETVKTIKTVASDTQGNSANSPEVYTSEFVFDTWNRLQSLTYPDGEVLTNQYDSGGSIRAAAGDKAGHHYIYLKRLEYDKFGQRTFVDLGNNVRTSYSYNPLNRRLANLKAGKGDGNLFQNLTYEYDKVGNILGQANSAAVTSPNQLGGATQYHYDYDDLYRLTHAEGTFDYQPDKQHSYQLDMVYDSIHNIKAKTQLHTLRQPSGKLITQKKTTYDWAYAYEGSQPHAPTLMGERTFSYDANGNQTGWEHDKNGTRRTIVWDAENRIQSIFDNGHEKTYKYDAAGERVIKAGPQGETVYVNQFFSMRNRSVGTKHVYAGKARLVSKLVKQENPTIRGKGKSKGKVGKGQAKSPSEAKWQYFYHPDHLGSSAYVTDYKGSLYQHLEYFAFGETFVEQSSNTQRTPYEFTAKELDEETGLYYFGARYYDARTSVWQNPDPILGKYLPIGDKEQDKKLPGGGVFQAINLNLYHYAAQNPIVYVDPDGNVVVMFFELSESKITAVDIGKTKGKPNGWDILKARVMVALGMGTTTNDVFSGNRYQNDSSYQHKVAEGPAPKGNYLVGEKYTHASSNPGDNEWYKLYGDDGKNGFSYDNVAVKDPSGRTVNRSGFNLHTGRASDGCVTVKSDVARGSATYPTSTQYDNLKNMLDTTEKYNYKGSDFTGIMVIQD